MIDRRNETFAFSNYKLDLIYIYFDSIEISI